MIKTLSRLFRRQATGPVTTKQRWLKLRYDAAQTTLKNQQHWSYSDNFGPRNANSADVRRVLRSRSRYEAYESNPYLRGMILTLVNDTIGKGPRLQITDERIEPARRRFLETRWQEWVDASRFRQKLWQLRLAKLIDGEAFLAAGNNPALGLPIELDWRFIEADQVSSPFASPGDTPREVDGIRLDGFGNPTSYYVLDQHPGDGWTGFAGREGRWLPSRFIVHWFRQERGSFRAVPETTASLPMCAILRRYTLAVLQAAETAASFAAVLESDGPPNTDPWTNPDTGETTDPAWETMPIESGQFLMLPWRYKLSQLRPEQPGAMYDGFVQSLLLEIARPLLIPHNRAIASSKDSNMASAVVDEHIYVSAIEMERAHCEENVLNPVLANWWAEALTVDDYLSEPLILDRRRLNDFDQRLAEYPSLRTRPPAHEWRWDRPGIEHTDPVKVQTARQIEYEMGWITDRDVQERWYNRDVDVWAADRRAQRDLHDDLGTQFPGEKMSEISEADATGSMDGE